MARRTDLTQPRTPRGFADRGAAELAATRKMVERIRETYELWGFDEIETPFFEYTDALGKFLPDQDRPNAGVFSLQDDDEQWMSLRYDLTAPLARHVAENFQKLAKPYRSYRFGPVFRNEKPGPGRFRQFLQFDADIVGAPSVAADAEMCMMMADAIEAVGVKRGDYVIKVNNRKILDGIVDSIGLTGPENASRRLSVFRSIDKLDRLGTEGVAALLGDGRMDESGDRTPGVGLTPGQVLDIVAFLRPRGSFDETTAHLSPELLADMAPGASEGLAKDSLLILRDWHAMLQDPKSVEGAKELIDIVNICYAANYGTRRVIFDPTVVRGLEYYTGTVFEAELTFTISDDEGRPIQFGSVGGGGRYDGLVGRFMADDVPATGFSIGVSRLQAALRALKGEETEAAVGPVVVLVLDKDRIGDSMALAAKLRGAGVAAEVYLGASGMKAQMKYADRRKSPCVVIQGSDEREKGEVTLKDLVEGAKAAAAIADRSEWTESRPAQVTVAEARLVEEVQAILARHR